MNKKCDRHTNMENENNLITNEEYREIQKEFNKISSLSSKSIFYRNMAYACWVIGIFSIILAITILI
ncbi:hypothetical protein SYNTR_1140 [Candidatus Syntrophocurvum alkaliphilum]|uniref:Uncharacterized protein n=1 Tax=Candidatus Syntrophocurvum alkaliphilum TaxID=2293317 RepID=A0A6I6DHH4_9FIRM|nr:hypothetical protein [Candidatus Syntrophocurvum alkaliphilum]QGT99733.1 hypothetical protein SYNTR_1140 [Candidatus Syntrophocurvum alkaliphilum]